MKVSLKVKMTGSILLLVLFALVMMTYYVLRDPGTLMQLLPRVR